jgi:hypothetical protein
MVPVTGDDAAGPLQDGIADRLLEFLALVRVHVCDWPRFNHHRISL